MQITAISFLATLILVLVSAAGGTSQYRNYRFRTYATMAGDPSLTPEQIDRFKQFFESFIAWGRWNGPLAPTVDEAKQQIEQLNQRVDELLWHPLASASDLMAKAMAARTYLEKLPNGQHAPEAQSIVQQWQAESAKREGEEKNRQLLEGCARELASAQSVQDIDKVLSRLGEGFPAPDHATRDQRAKREELQDQANKRRQELAWEQFLQSYRQELSRGALRAAAEVLVRHAPRDTQWRGLADAFPKEVEAALKNRIIPCLRDARFSDGRASLNEAVDALKHVESALRSDDADLADAMLKAQQKADTSWRAKINEREDQHLYEAVRKHKDKVGCDKYVENAPLGLMRSDVKQYRDYLERLDGELECDVELKILWDEKYVPDTEAGGGENYITVTVEGEVVWRSKNPVAEVPGEISGRVCTFSLKGKRDKEYTIRVAILEDDAFLTGWNDDGGSGEGRYTLEQLAREVRVPLRPAQGGFTNTAVLRIVKGWPEEPHLPEWDKGK